MANNKATTPNKNEIVLIADTKADVSSIGGRDRSTETNLHLHTRT